MSEKTWQILKEKRKRSGLSWNLFLVKLLEKDAINFRTITNKERN